MIIGTSAWASTIESSKTYTYQLTSTVIKNPRPILYVYSTEYLKDYVGEASIKYGLSPTQYQEIIKTVNCESGWQIYPKKNHISWGISQFTPPTWKRFGHGDIMDPISQLDVMAKMWSMGLQDRWDCFRLKLYK